MQKEEMVVQFTDAVRCPRRMVQQFDYTNANKKCTQADVDFTFMRDNKAIFVESKTANQEMAAWQKRFCQVLADTPNKVYVVVEHDTGIEPEVELVSGWEQKVREYWYCNDGQWTSLRAYGIPLWQFINNWFREVWGYNEDMVIPPKPPAHIC